MRLGPLLVCTLLTAGNLSGQTALSAGTYTQTFDTLGAGLPSGWSIRTGASAPLLGTDVSPSFVSSVTTWASASGNFRNVASALNPGAVSSDASSAQAAYTNRALGVRQTGGFGDPGASFSFNFSTLALSVGSISFSAQMLSVQTFSTIWVLQCATGASPTSWTTLATYTDPGVFGATTIEVPSATIGTALNHQSSAWLRIVALNAATGSGSRDTFAIDNFILVTASTLPPVIATQPASQTITAFQPVTLTVAAPDSGALTYQWRKNGSPISGAINASYVIPSVRTADAGNYDVVVTNSNGSTPSGSATLTVVKAPATITLSSLHAMHDGTPHAATATTSPPGLDVVLSYNGASTAPTLAGTYAVIATIDDANYAGTTSGSLSIATLAPPLITQQPAGGAFTAGDSFTLTVTATGAGPLSYRWYRDGAPLDDSHHRTGSSSASLIHTNISTVGFAGSYTVVVTNSASSVTSTPVVVTVAKAPQSLAFAALPDRLATDLPFLLTAISTAGLPVVFTIVSGPATLNGGMLTFTGATGAITVRASQPGDLNTLAAPEIDRTFIAGAVPIFSTQPVSHPAAIDESTTFTAAATGHPAPGLQWRKNSVTIPGATDASLTLASLTLADSARYDVVASNAFASVASTAATLTVTKRAQTITFPASAGSFTAASPIALNATASSGLPISYAILSGNALLTGSTLRGDGGTVVIRATQTGDLIYAAASPVDRSFEIVSGGGAPFITSSPSSLSAAAGATATFSVGAIGTPAPTFTWQKNGLVIAGAHSPSLTFPAITREDAATYTAVATNGFGSATSAPATLTVLTPPLFTLSPASRTAAVGSSVTFTATATGTPAPSYQWRKNAVAIPGATGASLLLRNLETTDAASYDVVATNSLGSVISAPAILMVSTFDFAGSYFGRIAGTPGEFALQVRADHTAIFLGHIPGPQTGLFALNLSVDPAGKFTAPVNRGNPALILTGTLAADGAVTGTIGNLDATFTGARTSGIVPAQNFAGFYQGAVIGSASTRVFAIVAPDGRSFVYLADFDHDTAASGTIDSHGRLSATTADDAVISLAFNSGVVTGTVRAPDGTTSPLAAAIDSLLGRERLANLSTRATTGPGAATTITGFTITGSVPKRVLIRAAGPSLASAPFHLSDALGNPQLQIFRGSTMIAHNDDWSVNFAEISSIAPSVGAFPFAPQSGDAALATTLAPGGYTVHITPSPAAATNESTGEILAEIYEAPDPGETPGMPRLANLSTRAAVGPAGVVIAGFVVSGHAPRRILLRAAGPTLATAPFNLPGMLENPVLRLYRASTMIAENDDWHRHVSVVHLTTVSSGLGAFPFVAGSRDSALLIYLEPGAYTAQVGDSSHASGLVLVEIYDAGP